MKNIIFKKFFTDSLPILPFLCRLYGNYSPFSKGSTSLLRRRDFFIAQNPPFRVLAESIVRDRHLWTASFKKGGININLKTLFLKKVFASTLLATMVMFYISAFFVVPIDVEAQVDVSKTTGSTATEKKTPCVSSKDEYCLLEPLVVGGVSKPSVNIATYLKEMFKIGIGLAGVFAVFMIIIGGFQYVTAESIGGKGSGREKIEGALWGLGLALGSFLILNTINPQLLEFSAGLEPIVVAELIVRDAYTDSNLALDQVRRNLNDCNAQEKGLRKEGQNEEADKLALQCKSDAIRDATAAKIAIVDVRNYFLLYNLNPFESVKEREEQKKTILAAGKDNLAIVHNKVIEKIKKEIETDTQDRRTRAGEKRKEADDLEKGTNGIYEEESGKKITDLRKEAVEIENDSTKKDKLSAKIGQLETKKTIDIVKMDQEYDTQRALDEISTYMVEGSKSKEIVGAIKRDIEKRSSTTYDKYKKDYLTEAEAIRVYGVEIIKKIDTAYKERLDQIEKNVKENTPYGYTPST